MSSRTCSGCSTALPKAEFSKNQWQKGNNAKCKGCIIGKSKEAEPEKSVPEPSLSPELREPAEEVFVVTKEEELTAAPAAAEKGKLATAILHYNSVTYLTYFSLHFERCVERNSFDDEIEAEEERIAAEEEAKKKAEEERIAAELAAKKKAEEERIAAELAAKKKAEEERIAAELAAKKEEEERAAAELAAEEEAKKKADQERMKKAEERVAAELKQLEKAEEERKKKQDEAKEVRIAAEATAKKKSEALEPAATKNGENKRPITPTKAANVLINCLDKETPAKGVKQSPKKDDDFGKEAECCIIL